MPPTARRRGDSNLTTDRKPWLSTLALDGRERLPEDGDNPAVDAVLDALDSGGQQELAEALRALVGG